MKSPTQLTVSVWTTRFLGTRDHALGLLRLLQELDDGRWTTPRAQVHDLPLAAVGQGEVPRRQLLGSAIRVTRVIVAEQPVRAPRLLRAALVLFFACALVVAVEIQTS